MIELPYGDDEAVVESVHLTFAIEDELAPHPGDGGGEITIGLIFDPGFDLDRIEKDYLGLGRAVVVLEQSPVFAYKPGVYGILDDGLMVGRIDEADRVDLFLIEGEREGFAPEGLTVTDLTAG